MMSLSNSQSTRVKAPKRIQRLVCKLAREINRLPVDQQQKELSKLRNLKYLIKPEVKKHRSKRHHKTERRERPQEPSFQREEDQVPRNLLDNFIWVDPDKMTSEITEKFNLVETTKRRFFKDKTCLVDGEYQIFRIWYIPDPTDFDCDDESCYSYGIGN
jgi:hypothetical protein